MYELQTEVIINGASFGIRNKGDFRMVLDCFKALSDETLTESERLFACMMIFYEDFNDVEDVVNHAEILEQLQSQMYYFFNCGEESLESNTDNHKIIDWEKDSNLICSAINNIAKQEIRELKYLHWWTFLGYYMSIDECLLSHVISIRYKIATNKKLEKHEQQFRQQNPQYFNIDMRTAEQKDAEAYIQRLWGEA